jgi:hypothetical protein
MDPFYGAVSLIAILFILAARLFRPKGTSAREDKVPG